MSKKIAVVTGARSDYGLLYWLMKAIQEDSVLSLQVIATGMHLSHEFGLTYECIIDDGFVINEKVETLLSSDSAVGVTKSIGLGVIGFADAFERLRPDMVILLGDRFEIFAAAQAAFIAKIPIGHIHGGELTLGAYDDGLRHSISKMSHFHFVATQTYRNRVIQMGENPRNVFDVGPMVLDSLTQLTMISKDVLAEKLGISFKKHNFLVTFHPETLDMQSPKDAFEKLLAALVDVKDTLFIFTRTNADTSGRIINDLIDVYCENNPDNAVSFTSLGHQNYLSLLKIVDLVVGNSSSGVIEAPFYRIPTIDIGNRQTGRFKPDSVINAAVDTLAIKKAILRGMSPEFKCNVNQMNLPYRTDGPAKNIVEIIKKLNISEYPLKKFHDVVFDEQASLVC